MQRWSTSRILRTASKCRSVWFITNLFLRWSSPAALWLNHWLPVCRFCIQTARVTWSILNLETSGNLDLTDTDSSHRSTSLTLHGQVSITLTRLMLVMKYSDVLNLLLMPMNAHQILIVWMESYQVVCKFIVKCIQKVFTPSHQSTLNLTKWKQNFLKFCKLVSHC